MTDEEWSDFRADVAANGLLQPIVTWRGSVVDGKHRQRACTETGVPPRYDSLPDDWDEWRVVTHCSSLHRRRNLTSAQRAAVSAEAIYKYGFKEAAKERQGEAVKARHAGKSLASARGRELGKAAKHAAVLMNSTERSTERAEFVRREAPAVHELVKDGKIPLKVAERIAKAPVEKQAALIKQLDTGARDTDAGDSWGTPAEWIDLARQVMGGIDLDPATNEEAQRVVKAGAYYTKQDNGLEQSWHGRVWMNPPYSQPLVSQFADRLLQEIEAGRVTQACVLVNNATDTKFCQRLLSRSAAALFPIGRVSFLVPGSGEALQGTRQGQVLIYFGPNVKRFATACGDRGWVGVSP